MIAPDNNNPEKGAFVVRVTIGEHLSRLQAKENSKPPALRRHVPSIAELSRVVSVSRTTLYNFDNGTTRKVSMDVMGEIITELHGMGFDTEIGDLFSIYPADLA